MAFHITTDCIGCQACKRICPSFAINGEKKEPHLVDEERCIDCGACGRVCPVKAVEDNFGLITTQIKKKDWPVPVVDTELCMSCRICIDTCPAGALDQTLQKKRNPHAFPFLPDQAVCMGCGFCADDCPVSAITMGQRELKKKKKTA